MTSTTSTTAQPGNELWFTRGTKRFERIGDTLNVVTEGASVQITLGSDGITRVKVVVTAPNVVVNKSVRKSAQATENKPEVTDASLAALRAQLTEPAPAKPAAAKPAARKPAARKPAAVKAGAAK
jgi:hypothetical protein